MTRALRVVQAELYDTGGINGEIRRLILSRQTSYSEIDLYTMLNIPHAQTTPQSSIT